MRLRPGSIDTAGVPVAPSKLIGVNFAANCSILSCGVCPTLAPGVISLQMQWFGQKPCLLAATHVGRRTDMCVHPGRFIARIFDLLGTDGRCANGIANVRLRTDTTYRHGPRCVSPPATIAGRRVMLQNLTDEVDECLQRAGHCRQCAEAALDPNTKADFLDMERRWLSLARSYEFSEQLSRFTAPLSWRVRP